MNDQPVNNTNGESVVYLYHGNLLKHERQYSIPAFRGLALRSDDPRDLIVSADGNFPVDDEVADAFQSQDVLEHLKPEMVIQTLDEIYRVLKPGGFFRLSVPDYRSPLLLKRTIFNYKGEALGDVAMGARAFVPDLNSDVQIKHVFQPGSNHLWLPTYEQISEYLSKSKFANSEIQFLHYIKADGGFSVAEIPKMDTFRVMRVPPRDNRAGGMPISIVVDIVKS